LPAELQEGDFADVEGLQFPLASWDPQSVDENVRRFVAAFQGQYGMEPNVYAAHAYDAMNILALAIREAGLDSQELRFYLNGMNPYPGVTGATAFDDKGERGRLRLARARARSNSLSPDNIVCGTH
jgi:ABC-type branched-subunit amino acid transport system substrate-binding protein